MSIYLLTLFLAMFFQGGGGVQAPCGGLTPCSSSGGITPVISLTLPCTANAQVNLTTSTSQGQGLYTCINGAWIHDAPDDGVIHAQAFGAQGKLQVESNGANF